jgi:hypothetical protein
MDGGPWLAISESIDRDTVTSMPCFLGWAALLLRLTAGEYAGGLRTATIEAGSGVVCVKPCEPLADAGRLRSWSVILNVGNNEVR